MGRPKLEFSSAYEKFRRLKRKVEYESRNSLTLITCLKEKGLSSVTHFTNYLAPTVQSTLNA